MRRTLVALVVLTLAALGPASLAAAASGVGARRGGGVGRGSGSGVPPGSPVFVRLSPDNNVITAVTTAAASVGLGPVTVDRFRADCSSIQDEVVVCRDAKLIQAGHRTATLAGPGWCVVSLDPRVGGAKSGVNQVTRAMRKCIAR